MQTQEVAPRHLSPAERAVAFSEASAARRQRALGPRARALEVENGNLVLTLYGGAIEDTKLIFPIATIPRLAAMNDEDLRDVKFLSGGLVLWWAAINFDIYTDTLIEHVTGIRSVRAHLAQAGSARTPAKAAAARENGKKGGRPRKPKEDES